MNHTYTSNHYVQISVAKIKSKTVLSRAQRHNTREKERLGTSNATHIDNSRLDYNDTIIQSLSSKSMWQDIMSRITGTDVDAAEAERLSKQSLHYADGTKVRSDAVLATEFEMGYPGDLMWHKFNAEGEPVPVDIDEDIDEEAMKSIEQGGKGYFLWPADTKEFEEWKARSVQFLKDNFHEENILSVEVHMDETMPHIHALMVPLEKDKDGHERLNCKGLFKNTPEGDLGNYRTLQAAYADHFVDMGYKRGRNFSNTRHYNMSYMVMLRELAQQEVEQTLPEDRQRAEEVFKATLARAVVAEDELARSNDAREKLAKTVKRIKDLEEEIDRLKRMQPVVTERRCELKGMELHPDREMIEDIYKPLQESLIESGREYYERELSVKLDLDHDEDILLDKDDDRNA